MKNLNYCNSNYTKNERCINHFHWNDRVQKIGKCKVVKKYLDNRFGDETTTINRYLTNVANNQCQ